MIRPGLAAALVAVACTTDRLPPATGQVIAPTALAATSAGDRDLLFIASSGNDELRALQICTRPLLPDGSRDPADTCPAREDFQFLPGPIRIFSAAIPSGEQPLHLAGVRLCVPATGASTCGGAAIIGGAALAAGADPVLHVFDARNLVDAMNKVAPARRPDPLPLDVPAADVIAFNALDGVIERPSPSGRAYLALPSTQAAPARLLALDVVLDATGRVQTPTVAGSCTFSDVEPRRLALTPGSNAAVYVADSKGLGAVRVDTSALTPAGAACPTVRISSFARPLRSIALSPAFLDETGSHPAGQILAGVTIDGSLLFARSSDGALFGLPPTSWDATSPEPMEPIQPGGPLREVAFLSTPPGCTAAPCTPVWVGAAVGGQQQRNNLVATATSDDGQAYYFDVLRRRVLNQNFYVGGNSPATDTPVITPASTTLSLAVDRLTAGVTRTGRWRSVFHSPMPGLERRGGTVTVNPDGTLRFETSGNSLAAWTGGLAKLRVGDVVSPYFSDKTTCPDVADQVPLQYELQIRAIPAANTLLLDPVAGFSPNPATCPSFGMVGEVRAVSDQPWTVFEGNDLRGRFRNGDPFTVLGMPWPPPPPAPPPDPVLRADLAAPRRFDYPLDYPAPPAAPPLRADDVAMSFHLNGPDPSIGTQIVFTAQSGVVPVVIRDPTVPQGLAWGVVPYSYAKVTNLVFVTVAGANVLLQSAAELPQAAIIAYR